MQRLTARRADNGLAYLKNVKQNEQEVDSPYPNTLKCILESFQRLASYEDTGLAPDKIPHWISVRERLPEHGERVLAYSPEMDGTEADIQVSKGFMVRRKRSDITHWMPLPLAPKEEK